LEGGTRLKAGGSNQVICIGSCCIEPAGVGVGAGVGVALVEGDRNGEGG
jgi:hypothetical protein